MISSIGYNLPASWHPNSRGSAEQKVFVQYSFAHELESTSAIILLDQCYWTHISAFCY